MEGAMVSGDPGAGALRPLNVGQAIGTSISLYARNAVKLWALSAVIIIPIEIVVTIIRRLSLPSDVFLSNGSLYTLTGQTGTTPATLAVTILSYLGTLLVTGAVFHLLIDSRLGRQHEIGESFALAGHRLGALLVAAVLTTLVVLVGFVLLVIPGIYLAVATALATPVVMLEGVGGARAISRSISLVRGRWWPTFGTLLLALVLYVIALVIVLVIASSLAGAAPSVACPSAATSAGFAGTCGNVTVYEIIVGAVTSLIYILMAPFWASVISVIYVDLRVRKEGLDHATLLDRPRVRGSYVPPQSGV